MKFSLVASVLAYLAIASDSADAFRWRGGVNWYAAPTFSAVKRDGMKSWTVGGTYAFAFCFKRKPVDPESIQVKIGNVELTSSAGDIKPATPEFFHHTVKAAGETIIEQQPGAIQRTIEFASLAEYEAFLKYQEDHKCYVADITIDENVKPGENRKLKLVNKNAFFKTIATKGVSIAPEEDYEFPRSFFYPVFHPRRAWKERSYRRAQQQRAKIAVAEAGNADTAPEAPADVPAVGPESATPEPSASAEEAIVGASKGAVSEMIEDGVKPSVAAAICQQAGAKLAAKNGFDPLIAAAACQQAADVAAAEAAADQQEA